MKKYKLINIKMKIRIFFEPLNGLKLKSIKLLLVGIVIGITAISLTLFVNLFINSLENNELNKAIKIIISFSILYLFSFFYIFSQRHTLVDVEEGIHKFIYEKYLKRFIIIDNKTYEKIGAGRYISSIKNGSGAWERSLITILLSLTITITILIFGLLQIFIVNKILFIMVLVSILILFLVLTKLNSQILEIGKEGADKIVEIDNDIIKIINSKFEFLQNNMINHQIDEIKRKTDDLNTKTWYRYMNYFEGTFLSANFFILLLRLGIFLYTLHLFLNGVFNAGVFAMLILVVTLIDQTFHYFIRNYKDLMKNYKDIQKMNELFLNTNQITNLYTGLNIDLGKELNIKIKDLSFSYNGKDTIINNIDFQIKWGEKISFVGPSGNGKSTIIKILTGYINDYNGSIKINGVELKDINLSNYYKQIGYLQQESPLFNGTIKDNLIFGLDKEFQDREIENILLENHCEFILKLKDGIYTEIGERGIMLSGGQKQRLAIAKIIIKNPKIIFLDEPTSALDYKSETYIQETLNKVFKGKTVITIAHRLKTIKNSDIIYYIEGGRILEYGNHYELIKKNGHYKKLYE